MKFRETRFAHQLAAVVLGLLLAVASVAFVSVPLSLGLHPGDGTRTAATTADWHPS